MGTQHTNGWRTVKGARLIAVADLDEGRAKRLAEEYGFARWATDYHEVVALDEVDVVSVCTPAFYHPEITVYAAQHGKHVLCEKPIALTLEEADRMINTTRSCGVKLGIGFQLRFAKATQQLKGLFHRGEIGRPVMWRQNASAPIRTVVGKPAMHDLKRGNGGPTVDICCHTFDLWRVVLRAEPVRVTARGFTFARGREELKDVEELAPDTIAILVEHSSGDMGVITITWGLPPGAQGGSMVDILGSKGAIILANKGLRVIREGGEERRIPCPSGDEKAEEIRYFAQRIIEGGEPEATGMDGKIALTVSLAALESMERGESVPLDTTG
jgi:predicted dehydrogenase